MKTTVDLSKLSAGEFSELVNTKETHRIRQEILKICFDILADFPHLTTTNDKAMLLLSIVDTLDEYPKPKKERLNQEMYRRVVVASSFVNVALDAARLGLCEYYSYSQAVSIIDDSLERSFSLLVDQ